METKMAEQTTSSDQTARPRSSDNASSSGLRYRSKSVGHADQDVRSLMEENDDARLEAEFGYTPVFKREFGYLSTFSFAVSISGLFATTMTTFSYPLIAGGSAAAVWCWLIGGAGCLCLALSVAELVSAYPTCGGLYYTVSRLAPPKYVPVLSWITGWVNLLGQIAGVASSEYGAAAMLLAAVSIGSDFQYQVTNEATIGVMAALTVVTGVANSLSTYWMEKMTKGYVIFHIAVLISACVSLLALTKNKHSAEYVFTHVESASGWTPPGFSFLFGFLSVSWTMTDYDATAHITEEISNPGLKAPWAISSAMIFTYVAGFLFNIVLCFCMGEPSEILSSPIFQPVAQIFYNSLGKGGGIFFTVAGFIIIKFVCFTAMQATARTVFAFSRDRLLPFSSVWVKVSGTSGTPLYAVWICVFLCIAINLIGLGSYTAIAGVFNVCAIALDLSYCLPIVCKLVFKKFEKGPWHMGRASPFVNVYACAWTTFVSVIFILPTAMPVTPNNMNYASVFFAAILVFAGLYWVLRGHTWYTGPVKQESHDASEENTEEPSVEATKDGATFGVEPPKANSESVEDKVVR